MYYALIGDVVNSRKIKDRNALQATLNRVLSTLNTEYHDTLASNLTITLGDEFQGLFTDFKSVLLTIDKIDTYFAAFETEKVEIRYGIGYGKVLTSINKELSIGSDGPVYWCAREAIDTIYTHNDSHNTNTYAVLGDKNSDTFNAFSRLIDATRNNWTQTQAQFMHGIFELSGYDEPKPKDIGNALNMTPQQVSNRLKSSYARQYIHARKTQIDLVTKGE